MFDLKEVVERYSCLEQVKYLIRNQQVAGSIPGSSSKEKNVSEFSPAFFSFINQKIHQFMRRDLDIH